jgi:hypothetical protein
MTNNNQDPGPAPATHVEFAQYHLPTLKTGDYVMALTQEVTIHGQDQPAFAAARRFRVQGPRYALDPADIQAVFPPDGGLGDHSAALPHVIFNRSSLPWERAADPQRPDLPWLALLLFDNTEKPAPVLCTLAELRAATTAAPWWPGLPAEVGEDAATRVTVIDVPRSRLQALGPDEDDLAYLAHVRRGTDDAGQLVGDELAVLMGNRLPSQGATATVHLVSLENRYTGGSFDFKEAADGDNVRLISLKSWSFACVDANQSFFQLLWNVDPYTQGRRTNGPATLQLPAIGVEEVDQYLAMGYVPLSHTLREGSRTVSWYHGPLIPWENTDSVDLPARAADQLTRFYPKHGMFDVSYAAAWELGRLLTLQTKQVATSLYAWKRRNAQQLHQAEQQILHLPFAPQLQNGTASDLEETVNGWFDNLNWLGGVPVNYLVPDERMLPAESIRFFWLDPVWIDCLLDGAFSIGRVTTADHAQDQAFADRPAQAGYQITGFLLRSDIVSGWPGLLVDGYDAGNNQLGQGRMERLSPNVLICLFRGVVSRVVLSQKPETLHFGLDGAVGAFFKKLRDPTKKYQESETTTIAAGDMPWRPEDARTLQIVALANLIQSKLSLDPFTAAQFALQMTEATTGVEFKQ